MIRDTTPEAEKRQQEILTRLSGEDRVCLAMKLSDTVRDLAWAGFCLRHSGVSEERLRVLFLRELHGIEVPERSERQSRERAI